MKPQIEQDSIKTQDAAQHGSPPSTLPTRDDLTHLAVTWEEQTPQAILGWAHETYGDRMTLACSFGGPSGMVLLDMALAINPHIPVFYLDTGLLFPETYALIETVKARYHINPVAVRSALSVAQQAEAHGDALGARDPDACCAIRKVAPQREYLAGYAAWITGIRRDQASTRRATPVLQWDDASGLAKISPLAPWGERDVWKYIVEHDVPYNPLHDQHYPSLGCTHCTRPVQAGEDPRAGRWSGFEKIECGIHPATAMADVAEQKVAATTVEDQPQPAADGRTLLALGLGAGSKVEHVKADSQYLRGAIDEQLHEDTTHFTEEQIHLLKFHGTYQQDDRDIRLARRSDKAYQFMVRSRIPAGVLTPEQYLAQDDIATRYGNGTLRITTRQAFQVHGVLKGDLRATIHDINDALLSTLAACGDVNRNVMACPAPIGDVAHLQIEAIAHELAMHLAPQSGAYHEIWIDNEKAATIGEDVEPLYGPTYLPRKFKIGVAFPGDNCIDVYTQDVGLVAELDGERLVGFTVLIGGGMGATHGKAETYPRLATPFCFVAPEEVVAVVEAIITVQRDYGDRTNRKHARMKYVVEERGIDWFRAETEQRLGRSLAAPHALEWHGATDHLGWHKQADGLWFLGLNVENGRIKDDGVLRLRSGLRHAIQRFAPQVRLTAQQNIILSGITTKQKSPLRLLLAKYGVITDPLTLGLVRHAMACPALPTCGLALAEAERALPDLIRQIDAEIRAMGFENEPLSVRMTGCPNGCARPYVGDIGIVGRSKDLYNIFLGGDPSLTRLNTLYAADITSDQIVATLRPLFQVWRDEREPREAFGDYCHRIGFAVLSERAGARANAYPPT